MLQLTYFPGTIAVAAAIALEEAGLAHDLIEIDFGQAEQTGQAYHAINPKGRVPALITSGGIITETGAILEYIAALAPGAGLVPADPLQAARMREAMYYCASTMHVNHAHKMRGHRWADSESAWADMTAKVPETMTASAAYVEEHVLQGPFVCGAELTLADPYFYTICRWLPGDGVDMTAFPGLRGFVAAMEGRASVRAVTQRGLLG